MTDILASAMVAPFMAMRGVAGADTFDKSSVKVAETLPEPLSGLPSRRLRSEVKQKRQSR